MHKTFAILALPLFVAGCWQSESEVECVDRLTENLSSSQILAGVGLQLAMIMNNKDLNVCDYTVLGNDILKID